MFDQRRCPKGKHCNFLHIFKNPGEESPPRPRSRSRERWNRSDKYHCLEFDKKFYTDIIGEDPLAIRATDQDTEIDEGVLVAGHLGEGVEIETAIPAIAHLTTGEGGVHIEVERGVIHLTGAGATHLIGALEEEETGVIRQIGTLVVKEERGVTHLRGAVHTTRRE